MVGKTAHNITISEMEEFTNRKSNIIVYNLKDNQCIPVTDASKIDKQAITDLIAYIGLSHKVDFKYFSRTGKAIPASTTFRPTKVVFGSQDQARLFTQTFWVSKKDPTKFPTLTKVSIAPDRTPNQLLLYKKCCAEFLKMNHQEQENHKITFKGYLPVIVKKRSKDQHGN